MTRLLLLAAVLALVGCGGTTGPTPTATPPKPAAKGEHHHEGPHDGAIPEWGEEEYHPEFTADHAAREATVYVLDGSTK